MLSLCYLWSAVYLPAHPHHRQQLQQVLREGQDRGGNPTEEKEIVLGGRQARSVKLNIEQYQVSIYYFYENF